MADRNGYIGRAPSDSAVTVARQTFSPTGVTTDFTFASGYTVGYLDLFLNGTKLIEGVDYNATDASTISLVSAAINGDVLEGVAYKAFNLGDKRIGIQSAGTHITTGVITAINFVGTGNTVQYDSSSKTVAVSIAGGGGGGGLGTAIKYSDETTVSPFSYIDLYATVKEDMLLDTTNAGVNTSIVVSVTPNIEIGSGVAVTVGAGKTMVIDILKIAEDIL